MNAMTDLGVTDQIALLMESHRVKTREHLRRKLGLSKNTVRNWERIGRVPEKYLRPARRPVQVIAALSVLRDSQLTDADARRAALTFLQQLEGTHG
jgi:hypothetical protein